MKPFSGKREKPITRESDSSGALSASREEPSLATPSSRVSSELDSTNNEMFLPVTDLPPNLIDRWLLAVPKRTVRLRLVFRGGQLYLAVGGLARHRHRELEKWLSTRKHEIFCG